MINATLCGGFQRLNAGSWVCCGCWSATLSALGTCWCHWQSLSALLRKIVKSGAGILRRGLAYWIRFKFTPCWTTNQWLMLHYVEASKAAECWKLGSLWMLEWEAILYIMSKPNLLRFEKCVFKTENRKLGLRWKICHFINQLCCRFLWPCSRLLLSSSPLCWLLQPFLLSAVPSEGKNTM